MYLFCRRKSLRKKGELRSAMIKVIKIVPLTGGREGTCEKFEPVLFFSFSHCICYQLCVLQPPRLSVQLSPVWLICSIATFSSTSWDVSCKELQKIGQKPWSNGYVLHVLDFIESAWLCSKTIDVCYHAGPAPNRSGSAWRKDTPWRQDHGESDLWFQPEGTK